MCDAQVSALQQLAVGRDEDVYKRQQYHDPAFLDRIHFYLPGWEFEQIRSEMFTSGFGFVVDYLAEILHNLRDADYSDRFEKYFELSSTLSTRDKDGIKKKMCIRDRTMRIRPCTRWLPVIWKSIWMTVCW